MRILLNLFLFVIPSLCQEETELQCSAKPGCQITQCDQAPLDWTKPGFNVDEHLQRNKFPITCVNKNAGKSQTSGNFLQLITGNIQDIRKVESNLKNIEEKVENNKDNIKGMADLYVKIMEQSTGMLLLKEEITDLRKITKNQSSEIADLREMNKNQSSEITDLRKMNKNQSLKIEKQSKEINEMRKENKEQSSELKQQSEKVKNQSEVISKQSTVISELREMNEIQSREIERQSKEIKEQSKKINNFRRDNNEKSSKFEQQIKKIQNLQKNLVKFKSNPGIWYEASNGNYYKLFHLKVNYPTAKENCEKYGARLATAGIREDNVRRELLPLLQAGDFKTWIGLNDIEVKGTYYWEDGVRGKSIPWVDGQPNNNKGNQDCVEIGSIWNWKLNDISCSKSRKYLCEIAV